MANGRGADLVIRPLGQMVSALSRYGQSLYQKPPDTIRGIDSEGWYSPLQPVKPFGPPGIEPRAFQFYAGQNLNWTPRSDAEYSAADLKALSTYPLARICIENVKDTVTRAPWEIQLRPHPNETRNEVASRAKGDDNLLKLNRFFEYPDREHNWQEWLRPLLDDMLVIDAASVLMRKNFKGDLAELAALRGEMITRYIDNNGFTPLPPSPAYAQNWWGLPLVNLTTDQLVYKPRNIAPRNTYASQLYGFCFDSETEILTRDRGFVRFPELRFSDYVATRNQETHEFEWQKPTAYINEPYEGDMYAFTSQSMDMLVTPPHRMLVSVSSSNGRNEKIMSAEELARGNNHERKIPVTSNWTGGIEVEAVHFPKTDYRGQDIEISGDDFCALIGAYLAEGNLRSAGGIEVAQRESSKGFIEYQALFRRLNSREKMNPYLSESDHTETSDGHNGRAFVCSYRALTSYFSQFGVAHEKFVPDVIRNAPRRQLDIFWHFFHLGDGYLYERENASGRGQSGIVRHESTTVSRRLADHLVEIAQKLGFSASVSVRPAHFAHVAKNKKQSFCRESYRVRCRYSKEMAVDAAKTEYAGMVHCVTVPNGIVYVRRNGKPCWSGNSPTEQMADEIQVGIERLKFVLSYYKEGSVPGVVQVVPRGTAPDRIEEAMEWMNSQLAGNLAARNQWRLIQGFNEPGKPDQIIMTKEPLLAGVYDEKHIREIAFGYGTSPQRLMKMIRTEGKGASDSAEVEGTLPWVLWVKGLVDTIIQKKMGFVEYEIAINPYAEPDPLKNAAALTMLVGKAIITPNEARKRVGEELRPEPEADRLGVITGTGFVPVGVPSVTAGVMVDDKGQVKPHPVTPTAPPPDPNPVGGDKNATRGSTPVSQEAGGGRSTGRNVGVPNGKESLDGKKKLEKRLASRIDPELLTPQSRQSIHTIQDAVHKVFLRQHDLALLQADRLIKLPWENLVKRKYGSVQFNLSKDDAERVLAIQVDTDDLDEKGREAQPHLTVLFGFHADVKPADINKITAGIGDIEITLGDFDVFPEGDHGEPLVISVKSEQLQELHKKLAELPHTDTHPEYRPHINIAYFKPGKAQPYADAGNPLKGETIVLRDLVFSGMDRTVTDLEKVYNSVSEVPSYVPKAHKKQWMAVWNSVYAREKKKGKSDKDAESSAFAQANGVAGPNAAKKFAKLLRKTVEEDAKAFADAVVALMEKQFLTLPGEVRAPLESAMLSGVSEGLLQIEIADAGLIASANNVAQTYAADRAAELVGMKYDTDGSLIRNPDAKWAISTTTRDKIQQIVAESFTKNTPIADIKAAIQEALREQSNKNGIFSEARAAMIARTETMRAQVGGNFDVWQKSGVVKKVKWLTSNLEPCDECEGNEGQEVEIGKLFRSGVAMPPDHPNCFVGETIFSSFDNVTKYFRRWFHGDVLTFSIATGEYFTVTPNHPILTNYGWLPARAIKQGMDLLYCADPRASISRVNPHQHLMPTMAQDVPTSFSKSSFMTPHSMPVSAEDFHGDGSGNSKVDIVFSDRLIKNKRQAFLCKTLSKSIFPSRHARRSFLSSPRCAVESAQRNMATTDRVVRCAHNISALPLGISAPVQNVRFTNVSDFKPHVLPSSSQRSVMHTDQGGQLDASSPGNVPFVKPYDHAVRNVSSLLTPRKFHGRMFVSDRQTFRDKRFSNAIDLASDNIGNILQRFAGLIKAVPVLNVSSMQFSGYVHNLETAKGYYIANGVFVHNCACVIIVSELN